MTGGADENVLTTGIGGAGAYAIGGGAIDEIGFETTVTVVPPSESTGTAAWPPRTPPSTRMLDMVITFIGAFPRF